MFSMSTFVLNILVAIKDQDGVVIANAGLIKFGQYDENPYKF